jgi:hypothetical protein
MQKQKQKKTEDLTTYYREYRSTNRDHLRCMEKVRYYKSKGLSNEEIELFGDCSADFFKLKLIYSNIKEKLPNLDILGELSKTPQKIEL